MQDDIARRVVEGLALPLVGERHTPSPDAPHNPTAYEHYLRANELARAYEGMVNARTLYEQSLEVDPNFAPAWAHLGRCHRVIGKFIDPAPDSDRRAEEAFVRAITLNPRLSVAHKFYANLEAETGRAPDAIVRLLNEATRHGNDPELFAGLVHACRYAGLFEESLAAHAEARRLDPNIATSFQQTVMMKGDIDRLVSLDPRDRIPGRRSRHPCHRPRPGRPPRRGPAGTGQHDATIGYSHISGLDVTSRGLARSANRRHDVHAFCHDAVEDLRRPRSHLSGRMVAV
jgi:tetratricopeptide (TPR) repeat protein